jgi:hypothetical protein
MSNSGLLSWGNSTLIGSSDTVAALFRWIGIIFPADVRFQKVREIGGNLFYDEAVFL